MNIVVRASTINWHLNPGDTQEAEALLKLNSDNLLFVGDNAYTLDSIRNTSSDKASVISEVVAPVVIERGDKKKATRMPDVASVRPKPKVSETDKKVQSVGVADKIVLAKRSPSAQAVFAKKPSEAKKPIEATESKECSYSSREEQLKALEKELLAWKCDRQLLSPKNNLIFFPPTTVLNTLWERFKDLPIYSFSDLGISKKENLYDYFRHDSFFEEGKHPIFFVEEYGVHYMVLKLKINISEEPIIEVFKLVPKESDATLEWHYMYKKNSKGEFASVSEILWEKDSKSFFTKSSKESLVDLLNGSTVKVKGDNYRFIEMPVQAKMTKLDKSYIL